MAKAVELKTERSVPQPTGWWFEQDDFWVRPRSGYGSAGSYTGKVCRICGKRTNGETGRRGDQSKLHHQDCVLYAPAVEADQAWARKRQIEARRYLLARALSTAKEVLRMVDDGLLSPQEAEIWQGHSNAWQAELDGLPEEE